MAGFDSATQLIKNNDQFIKTTDVDCLKGGEGLGQEPDVLQRAGEFKFQSLNKYKHQNVAVLRLRIRIILPDTDTILVCTKNVYEIKMLGPARTVEEHSLCKFLVPRDRRLNTLHARIF